MKKVADQNTKALIRRYLVWCYKTTKEDLDRIDRKFTQLSVDEFILQYLNKDMKTVPSPIQKDFQDKVLQFKEYKSKKEEDAFSQKYTDVKRKVPNAQYQYLQSRKEAIEKAIIHFLGKNDLNEIKTCYEQEMTKRIFESREH